LHQWVKNLLLWVPLFTAFVFTDPRILQLAAQAFLAFSLVASATYISNDLWDLAADRQHARKRRRPFASGLLPIHHGVAVACGLLVLGLAMGAAVSGSFLAMLVGYVVLTTAYSWSLKRYVVLDVLMLAVLYTWRVIAGAVATGLAVSTWLLAFSVFLFFSLALVKRCAELVSLTQSDQAHSHGRDYRTQDLVVLWPMGVGAGLCSVVVFGLFAGSPETASCYADPRLLWVVAIGLMYWLTRLWVKTARGEMHDDPIVFAFKDRGSRVTVAIMVLLTGAARALNIP
jgi:4-hydroxybenzoate polyprenyltransferase